MNHPTGAELQTVMSAVCVGVVCFMKSVFKEVLLQTNFTSSAQQQTSSSLHHQLWPANMPTMVSEYTLSLMMIATYLNTYL